MKKILSTQLKTSTFLNNYIFSKNKKSLKKIRVTKDMVKKVQADLEDKYHNIIEDIKE